MRESQTFFGAGSRVVVAVVAKERGSLAMNT